MKKLSFLFCLLGLALLLVVPASVSACNYAQAAFVQSYFQPVSFALLQPYVQQVQLQTYAPPVLQQQVNVQSYSPPVLLQQQSYSGGFSSYGQMARFNQVRQVNVVKEKVVVKAKAPVVKSKTKIKTRG